MTSSSPLAFSEQRLAAGATRLATRYKGIASVETVQEPLVDSYSRLAAPRVNSSRTQLSHRPAPQRNQPVPSTPLTSVLFVCVHNAGRSQMAAGFLQHLAGERVEVRSAGSLPADQVNPSAVDAMREVGIDITDAVPKILTTEAVKASDYVISMGCGDACPIFPGKKYLDWDLDDPAGKDVAAVRPIRDEIRQRVEALIAQIDN